MVSGYRIGPEHLAKICYRCASRFAVTSSAAIPARIAMFSDEKICAPKWTMATINIIAPPRIPIGG